MSPNHQTKRTAFAFIALVITLACLPLPAQAQIPPGFEADLIANNDFENGATPLGFEAISENDGSVARTTADPIAGSGSLKVTVNSYGRVVAFHAYGYGSGPYTRSVTLSAKLRVDSATVSGRELTACAVAYFMDSQEPSQICRNFAVDPNNVVDVHLSLDTNERQLNYLFPQFKLDDTGTIEATVDDVHYYVDEAETPTVPTGFERVDLITNQEFENSEADLGFQAISSNDGSVAHSTTDPILGAGSLKIDVNSYGRVIAYHQYGYGSGPYARSLTLSAMLRVDSSTVPGRELKACAIAYFMDSQEPSEICQSFPVDAENFVDVYLTLDTEDRQLNYVFPQFKLDDTGTIEATVDEVHYYVVQPVP
jgi:hypothetical protein